MKTNFRLLGIGLWLCLLPGLLQAQEILTGFNHGIVPSTAKSRDLTVQTLPFYDDFSSSLIYPDSTKWASRNIYVNPGFPRNPITRNAATFDVLDANGEVYEYAISNPFIAEYLYSTTIRLDSVFDPEPAALSPADSIYLSFFYQPQGNGNPPEVYDSLVLEFGIPNEYDTTWQHIWSTPGMTLSQFLQENDSNYFKQVMIPITDLKYFTSNFFFRFYNYASIANQSQPTNRGNEDNWSIDVVYLDCHRTASDPSYPKVSFTGTAPSFLQRYQSMPYKHYCSNPVSNMAERFEYQVSNLDKLPHTVKYCYRFDQVNGQQHSSYDYDAPGNHPIDLSDQAFAQTQRSFITKAFSLDYSRDTTSYLIRHYISDSTCFPPLVDSMVYHQGFYNYFAYDDGIPEMGYGVEPAEGAFAVKFELAEVDTLSGVQILFNHTLNDANYKYFDIVVWKDNNGKPGDEVYRLKYLKPKWEEGHLYRFSYYDFDQLIRLNGAFYVGIEQRESGLINIGFDTSKDNSQYNFFNVTGSWQPSTKPGSIMIRPVVGKGYYIGVDESHDDSQVRVYPNPASNVINVEGVDGQATLRLFDLTGRLILTTREHSIPTTSLSGGLYLLQIQTSEGATIHRKITVKP